MRKTQLSIALNCMDSSLRQKILDTFNHYEGVTAIFDGGYSQKRINEIHQNNKTAVFPSPYRVTENLAAGVIVINAFDPSTGVNLHNFYENIIMVGNGCPKLTSQIEGIADKYGLDLGDYINEDGMVVNHDSKSDCLLCRIYADDRQARKALEENDQIYANPSPMNIVLFESEHFYVVPAKGALVRGYVMIVPKEHHLSFAALPHEQLIESMQVLEDLKNIFRKIYGRDDFLVFEHGSGKEGTCKHEKSIVHAHLHVIPYSPLVDKETMTKFHLTPLDLTKISEYKDVPYLLYADSQTDWHISADPNVYIPRQCVRQLLGDNLGLSGQLWNWRRHSFMDEIRDTVNDYYRYLQSCFFVLDPRISQATAGFMLQMNRRSSTN